MCSPFDTPQDQPNQAMHCLLLHLRHHPLPEPQKSSMQVSMLPTGQHPSWSRFQLPLHFRMRLYSHFATQRCEGSEAWSLLALRSHVSS